MLKPLAVKIYRPRSVDSEHPPSLSSWSAWARTGHTHANMAIISFCFVTFSYVTSLELVVSRLPMAPSLDDLVVRFWLLGFLTQILMTPQQHPGPPRAKKKILGWRARSRCGSAHKWHPSARFAFLEVERRSDTGCCRMKSGFTTCHRHRVICRSEQPLNSNGEGYTQPAQVVSRTQASRLSVPRPFGCGPWMSLRSGDRKRKLSSPKRVQRTGAGQLLTVRRNSGCDQKKKTEHEAPFFSSRTACGYWP